MFSSNVASTSDYISRICSILFHNPKNTSSSSFKKLHDDFFSVLVWWKVAHVAFEMRD